MLLKQYPIINNYMEIPKKIHNSLQRLTRCEQIKKHNTLTEWQCSDEYSTIDIEHFIRIRNYVINKYRNNDIYISPSLLDETIYPLLKTTNPNNILEEIDNAIKLNNLHDNAIVIFPLNSFGIVDSFDLLHNKNKNDYLNLNEFSVYPQTNNLIDSVDIIKNYINKIKFKYRSKIIHGLGEHSLRAKKYNWLSSNPFIVFHFRFSSNYNYENIDIIFDRIRYFTNKLYFIYSLVATSNQNKFLSSREINNNETYDIHHYISIFPSKDNVDIRCQPINLSQLMMYELSYMNIDVSQKAFMNKRINKLIQPLEDVFNGYIKYQLTKNKEYLKYYRINNSLNYFRRSFKTDIVEDKIVYFNTAFEIALLDDYMGGKKINITKRLWDSINYIKDMDEKDITYNMSNLIDDRNNIIHGGYPSAHKHNFNYLNMVYCRLILSIMKNINTIDSTNNNYMTHYYDKLKKRVTENV